jgi:xylulokinase
MSRFLLGLDLGSSSVKAALVEADSGRPVASAFSPEVEMPIHAPRPGWAEQDPDTWWAEAKAAIGKLSLQVPFKKDDILAIGISYQMHGLVCVDATGRVLRPAIIWCDSRAVGIGDKAFDALGHEYCLSSYLNSPGNFTASKLKWVKDHEPDVFDRITKVMLPGDYLAYRLTGRMATTVSGLSEGICWDFKHRSVADRLMTYYGTPASLYCETVPTFGEQGRLSAEAAEALGIAAGVPVSYRAGDQPNNAYSLRVLEPGELAATAGTSGVVYGITDRINPDPLSRVNSFVHVNDSAGAMRNGILLCINGTGSSYAWMRKNLAFSGYQQMNELAATAPPGSRGLSFFPFGNGAERVLVNRNPGATLQGLDYNTHDRADMARVVQEGVAYALRYGMDIMESMQMPVKVMRAGHANMFLSPVFRQVLANVSGALIEIYETDGAQGAARAAGVGAGYYSSYQESFRGLRQIMLEEPDARLCSRYQELYADWKQALERSLAT